MSLLNETQGGLAHCGLLAVVACLVAGCDTMSLNRATPDPQSPPPVAVSTPATPALPANDHPLLISQPPEALAGQRAVQMGVVLTILHVQVPHAERRHADPLWNHLRENLFDSTTSLRLHQNGLRVGIGYGRWWDAVQAALDSISGVRSIELDPVRVPPSYPLALELDTEAREQTLFFVDADGVLSGETWPHSRNVLRLSYDLNLEHPERIRLAVVPEVRQRLEGWEWVRAEGGLVQRPNYSGRAFGAAGFVLDLEPGEFLLVAPGEQADVFGLVGGRFLARDEDGQRYDSYVFMRADVDHVAWRN